MSSIPFLNQVQDSPRMMLKILLYAYSQKMSSSRVIIKKVYARIMVKGGETDDLIRELQAAYNPA